MLALRLGVLLAMLVSLLGTAPARAETASTGPLDEIRLLVRFRPDATAGQRIAAIQSVGGYVDAEIPQLGVTRVVVPTRDDLGATADPLLVLSGHAAVAHAEADQTVRLSFVPNDQYYGSHPSAESGQWGIRKALVDRAWDTARGKSSVTVAILDTGVDPTHPDLAGALVAGNTFVSSPDDECTPGTTRDDNSHGTHVAGVVGATGDNGVGVAGVAFGVRVMAVKVLDCTGQGNLSDVANGLVWAVDNGARIVNLSLGSVSDSTTLRSAVTYATQRGVLVVSASGNCGTSGEKCLSLNQVEYPAAYADVLAVAATDEDDSIAFFSTRNSTVDVAAPGRRIVSTTPTYATYLSQRATNPAALNYAVFSGTSQAAPFAAGLAALIWSAEPSLTPAQVTERIRSTADDLGTTGVDESYGAGRVNALKAVAQSAEVYGATVDASALPNAARPGESFVGRVTVTNTSSFAWRSASPNAVRIDWSWLDGFGNAVPGVSGVMALPSDLAIGASATLVGAIAAPIVPAGQASATTPVPYTLRLELVRDGIATFPQKGVPATSVTIALGSGFGATFTPTAQAATFDSGTTGTLEVAVKNTGTIIWAGGATANPITLSYHWLRTDGSLVTWDGLRAPLLADLPPGQAVTLRLPVSPPDQAGTYLLRLDLVHEGVTWLSAVGVTPVDIAANVRAAYVASYNEIGTLPVLLPGGRAQVAVSVTNNGTVLWNAGGNLPMRIAAHVVSPTGGIVLWDGARTLLPADLKPGETLATNVTVDAPIFPGSYRAQVDVVREGLTWLSGLGVQTREADLIVAADYRAELPTGALTVSRANPVASVTIRNIGIATWTVAPTAPLNVSAHWFDASGATLRWDGPRTPITATVAPGASVTLDVQLGTPPEGAATVQIDLVSEGVRWFGAGLIRPVTLAP